MEPTENILSSCKRATFLIEKQQFKALSLNEQLKLKMHLAVCSWCRIYERQSKNIQLLMSSVFKQSAAQTKQLDEAFKNKLKNLIKRKLKDE